MPHPLFALSRPDVSRILLGCGCAALVLGALVWVPRPILAAEAAVPIAQRLPASALFAVSAGDMAEASAAFQQSALGAKLCGEEFAPLIEQLGKQNRAAPLYLQPSFGFSWADVSQLHEPAALTIFPLPDKVTGIACLFLSSAGATDTHPALAKAAEYFTAHGYRGTQRKLPQGSLSIYERAASGSMPAETRVLFVGAGIYGVANSVAAAEAMLEVAPEKSLAGQELFVKCSVGALAETPAQPAEVSMFVRPLELWDLLHKPEPAAADKVKPAGKADTTAAKTDKAGKKSTPATKGAPKDGKSSQTKKDKDKTEKPPKPKADPLETYRHLGFGAAQAVALRANFLAAEPCQWDCQAQVVVEKPLPKAMRMLDFLPGPFVGPPTWAAADVTRLARWQWDFGIAMKGFGNLFDETNEPGPDGEGLFEDMLDGLRDDPEGVQVDLRRELFPNLGPEMVSVEAQGVATEKGKDAPKRQAYVAAVKNQPKVIDVLTRFYKGDDRVEQSKVGDYEMWTVPEGSSLFVEGQNEGGSVVTLRVLACGNKQVVFGTDVDQVKQIISGATNAKLTEDAGWNGLLDWIKAGAGAKLDLWALARLDEELGPSYRTAAQPPADKEEAKHGGMSTLWRVLLFGTGEHSTELPYTTVPSWEHVGTAFSRAGLLLVPSEDGWALRSGMLRTADSSSR